MVEIPVTANPLRPGAPLGLGALNHYGESELLNVVKSSALRTIVFLIHPWELIDAARAYPMLPTGYAKACSPSVGPLRRFLSATREIMEISTLREVAKSFDAE